VLVKFDIINIGQTMMQTIRFFKTKLNVVRLFLTF